jgi:hypothetical protein
MVQEAGLTNGIEFAIGGKLRGFENLIISVRYGYYEKLLFLGVFRK